MGVCVCGSDGWGGRGSAPAALILCLAAPWQSGPIGSENYRKADELAVASEGTVWSGACSDRQTWKLRLRHTSEAPATRRVLRALRLVVLHSITTRSCCMLLHSASSCCIYFTLSASLAACCNTHCAACASFSCSALHSLSLLP